MAPLLCSSRMISITAPMRYTIIPYAAHTLSTTYQMRWERHRRRNSVVYGSRCRHNQHNFIDGRCSHSEMICVPVAVYHPSIDVVIGPIAVAQYGSRSVAAVVVKRDDQVVYNGRILYFAIKKINAHLMLKLNRIGLNQYYIIKHIINLQIISIVMYWNVILMVYCYYTLSILLVSS